MILEHISRHRALSMLLAVPAVLILAGVATACGGSGDDDTGPTATATSAAASPTTSGGNGNGATGDPVTIEMTDSVFTPSEITVPVNTAVEITVENKGVAIHNMHVLSKDQEGKDFTSDMLVNPGTSSTFEVEFTKTGKYDFVCDLHLPAMSGVITVE